MVDVGKGTLSQPAWHLHFVQLNKVNSLGFVLSGYLQVNTFKTAFQQILKII